MSANIPLEGGTPSKVELVAIIGRFYSPLETITIIRPKWSLMDRFLTLPHWKEGISFSGTWLLSPFLVSLGFIIASNIARPKFDFFQNKLETSFSAYEDDLCGRGSSTMGWDRCTRHHLVNSVAPNHVLDSIWNSKHGRKFEIVAPLWRITYACSVLSVSDCCQVNVETGRSIGQRSSWRL